ncbi:MAG: SLC45 family MFS transporter [Ruminococcaceae bacterium]|nr:SLC45 family MFS transporter [Oscillospiraceae bacterium]
MAETKLNYKKTILTGFGFLATSIAWAIYDPYITKILNRLLTESATVTKMSDFLVEKLPILARLAEAQGEDVVLAGGGFTLVPLFIGIIMTFDNIFGVIFQPTFGRLSDECHSKLGKRRPFIVAGAPISALFFFLVPVVYLATKSLPLTMICIILFVFTMSLWRAPVVALMPDLTPPALRSEGNAVINLMGGIGSAVGMVAGTIGIALCGLIGGISKEAIAADETLSFPYVFAIGSLVMIAGMLVLLFCVKEPDSRIKLQGEANAYADSKARKAAEKEAKKAERAARKAVKLSAGERKSLLFMLGTLFFLFCGSNAITTFFSLFAQEILHKPTAEATILMLIFAVMSGVAALPAGKMGKKLGRKKTIVVGLAVFLVAFVVFFGVFVALLGGQGLSINKYVNVNNSYIAVEEKINEYNADLSDAAKAEGIDLPEGSTLNIDGYIAFLTDGSEADKYMEFELFLGEESTVISNAVVTAAVNILELEEGTTFGEALAAVQNAVSKVTSILGVLIYPVLILGGAANMFITVNTLPLVLEIGGIDKVGTFTGYYYTATFSAQIASPILYGFIRMFAGTYMSLFYYSPVMFALACLLLVFVKHGEAVPDALIKEAEEAGD